MTSTTPRTALNIPWQHLLRASLRECTYLPDPLARDYMRGYVLDRYRRASDRPGRPDSQKIRSARHGLSLLRRANEGYQFPLEKVLLLSYGRVGKRRHELLADFLKPPTPKDTEAVKALVAQPAEFEDGWEAPAKVMSLAKSQLHNGIIMTSRLRPRVLKLQPQVPELNAWFKPLPAVRRRNIRKKWYQYTLSCLWPPLPEQDLATLDGLISGEIPWKPVKRRQVTSTTSTAASTDHQLSDFLVDGPQKGTTFRQFVNGRPHNITARFMHRQWRRLSALVPRQEWNPRSGKWLFTWDSAKPKPKVTLHVDPDVDVADVFGDQTPQPRRRIKLTNG